jgi:catecholate siderophore receptor
MSLPVPSRLGLTLATALLLPCPALALAAAPAAATAGTASADTGGTDSEAGDAGAADGAGAAGAGRTRRAAPLPAVTVRGGEGYGAEATATATKTDTPLIDVPQQVTVVGAALIRDQAMQGIGDALRYVPGVGIAQGEGNRDTPILRGNSSTADLFVDGVRDDVQYFRDLYNIERVEVLNGPNAMIFGRGGSGGLVNRVTKQPVRESAREATLVLGAWNRRRASIDVNEPMGERVAFRVNAMAEDSEGFRQGFDVQRWGINPTLALDPGDDTMVVLGAERFHDERTADRGVPSHAGRPLDVAPETFFGDPRRSRSRADVDAFDALVTHDFNDSLSLANRTRIAHYDKFYQNVYPSAVNAAGTRVTIAAYNNATERRNLFNQTDLVLRAGTGMVRHTLLAGAEFGRQETDNLRTTGSFPGGGASCGTSSNTGFCLPIASPIYSGPLLFAPSATDADNHGVARTAALYVQDQLELGEHWQVVAGLRYDRFEAGLDNHRNATHLDASDGTLSPRLGLVYKPTAEVSVYASGSRAFLPRSGEQLSSLTPSNQALEPEGFRNTELGVKWNLRPGLMASAAAYRLVRSNVAVLDTTIPGNTTQLALLPGDAQRVRGVELGLSGNVTERWSLVGALAWQDGEILEDIRTSPTAVLPAGTVLAQLPRRSFSLWNRYDFDDAWGVGLGLVSRSAMYSSTSNAVTLPGYVRADAALFYRASDAVQLQVNVENLADTRYIATANSDSNISPGSPRSVTVSLHLDF